MSSFWPVYLGGRFFFRLSDFFHHWYVEASRFMGHGFLNLLASLDRVFALRITLHYFWKPLYGDYSPIGRVLGPIFRSGRIVVAILFYAVMAAIFIVIYLAWLAAPFAFLFMASRQLFGI